MKRLDVGGAVRPIYGSLDIERLRKRQAELKRTRLTMFGHTKIPKDEVSSASINVYLPRRFKMTFTNILCKDEISNLRFLLLLQLYEILLHISENDT